MAGRATTRGVTIRKYASGNEKLQLAFTYKGRLCREQLDIPVTKANIKFAEQTLSSIKLDIARGSFDYARYFPNSKMAKLSGDKLISILLEEHYGYLKEKSIRQKSTLNNKRKNYQNHILPNFGSLTVSELKVTHITKWIKKSGLARGTVRGILSIMNPVLDEAVAGEIISSNPARMINFAELYPKRNKNKEKNERIDPVPLKEIPQLLEHARTEAALFEFALFTGVRKQELPLVRWDKIDWDKHQILITQAVGTMDKDQEYIKDTKTEEERIIDILPPAMEVLKSQRELTQLHSEYVFINPRTKDRYALKSMTFFWNSTLKRAKLRHRSIKQTRHTFASLMLSKGENPMWVAKQLGHADLNMLRDHYGKWMDESDERGYTPKNDWNYTANAREKRAKQ